MKTTSVFKNEEKQENIIGQEGLVYNTETLGDIINKDTDGDGILDWEENLWGTSPTEKETTPGTLDSVAIEELKAQKVERAELEEGFENPDTENLTQTERFSRELFSTISALSQNGPLDQATVDELGNALAEKINNPSVQKVFLLSDLKIIQDDGYQSIKNYDDTLNSIYQKYPVERTVMDVLQDFVADEENVDTAVLLELDPINVRVQGIIEDMTRMDVPQSLARLHLDVINGLQRLSENIDNIKFFDTDVIIALGAISQYETNTDFLVEVMTDLTDAISQKLSN